ncbi:MAG: CHRD domain-containing protein [Xanthobacteraceae bacterium]
MTPRSLAVHAFAIAAGFAIAMPAAAEMLTMKVPLSGASEVPANTSSARGEADVTFDTTSRKLAWKVSYSGLTGPATAAHFHGPADPGKNAAIVVPIPNPGASGAEGSATLTEAQAADLVAGRYYINVHTAAHPAGEIRGQVKK